MFGDKIGQLFILQAKFEWRRIDEKVMTRFQMK